MGDARLLIDGRNIGAVRTPYRGKRVQIEGDTGVAIAVQLDADVSVVSQLSPHGAIALAVKLIDELTGPYSVQILGDQICPPKLYAAWRTLHEAEREAKTIRVPLP